MLGSIPSISPCDTHTLWYQALFPLRPQDQLRHAPEESSSQPTENVNKIKLSASTRKDSLQNLIADEELIEQRKLHIRHFGATWIRPAGIAKTYQAMIDEAVERSEQEALARREAALLEQTAAAEDEERRRNGTTNLFGAGGRANLDTSMAGDQERDLDEDVPEADELLLDDDSLADEEEAHDLDDEIPEAGSYQHTDTDVEDSSSNEDVHDEADDSTTSVL